MATADQIADLRRKIGEPTQDPYTDAALSDLIDAGTDPRLIAKDIWEEKAASVVDLVNISEGGSSRSNGALHAQYLAMAKNFATDVAADAGPSRAPRSREAVRQ